MSTLARITVSALVNKPVAHVWGTWTEPAHITQWNAASYEWHRREATNDLRSGSRSSSTMAPGDGP